MAGTTHRHQLCGLIKQFCHRRPSLFAPWTVLGSRRQWWLGLDIVSESTAGGDDESERDEPDADVDGDQDGHEALAGDRRHRNRYERAIGRVDPRMEEECQQDAVGAVVDPCQEEREADDVHDTKDDSGEFRDKPHDVVYGVRIGRQLREVPERPDDAE